MKLSIEVSDGSMEDEVIIRCGRVDENVRKIQEYILSMTAPKITFFKGTQEYYLQIEDILFFETGGEHVFAHTTSDAFRVKLKLYELEEKLPRCFMRIAKGTIVNTKHIYAINRNLTSASQICFTGTHKHIYVSRHYYKPLIEKMNDRSF